MVKREVGRGERVIPGLWRLRLPLPWPGVPHGNAWAIAAGSGIVLVDCGYHGPGSLAHLERALEAALARRMEVARQSGVSGAAIESYAEQAKEMPSGLAAAIDPDRALVDGVAIETDLGTWTTYETPGHAPPTSACISPSAGSSSPATTCSDGSRSITTTATPLIRSASSSIRWTAPTRSMPGRLRAERDGDVERWRAVE